MARILRSISSTGFTFALGLVLASAAAQAQAQTSICKPNTAKVENVYREELQDKVTVPGKPPIQVVRKFRNMKLRDTLTVEVSDLDTLVEEAKCRGKDIVLYLDDRPLTDVAAYPPTATTQKLLRFPLQRTEASRDVWTYILGRPGFSPRKTKVSIGFADQYAIPTKSSQASTISLWVIPTGWFLFWLLLFTIFLLGFFYLARRTDVLRDAVPIAKEGARRPYSLARTQASWWFFLVLAAYMFIGMITGDFSTSITPTVLILMGISAGTVVGSAFVDASKTNPDTNKRELTAKQSLEAEIQQLDTDIQTAEAALKSNPNDVAAAQVLAAKLAEREEKLSQLHKLKNESEYFLQDILSDINGVNFHRFQMLVWTVVLGIIFVSQVYKALAMPEFSDTLLSLMGISAGTYLGLKIPEDTVPKT
jgi:hypothetical protein